MNPKLKLYIQISVVVVLLILTSFTTIKFREWVKPTPKVRVVFDECVFSDIPTLKPVSFVTDYYFNACRLNGQDFGETITPAEVDEAIEKIEKGEK